MMIVVCDTSPVNTLVLIDGVDLLPQRFTTVVLPAGVLAELQHPRTPPRVASWARQLPPWVRVISPKGPVEDAGLGRGEAAASGNCELGRGLLSRKKNATEAGAGRFEKPAPDARAAPPEARESLISRKTVAEVPLIGLSVRAHFEHEGPFVRHNRERRPPNPCDAAGPYL